MNYFAIILFSFFSIAGYSQYAPQAGLSGSTAISAYSSLFTGWATTCTIQRGYMDIANPSLGFVTNGDSSMAIGPADYGVVSLGDSGIATLTFEHPLFNGPGPDLAVFENGFRNPSDSTEAYLELAFVEVSSDGVNFFRFPANSLTNDNVQIAGSGTYMDATKINNLAGKYIAIYGTPFDLDELAGIPLLNIDSITYVRVIDVIGSIGTHCTKDSMNRKINDPYPTPFPTGGFDLDAVGAINQKNVSIQDIKLNDKNSIKIYPNPVNDVLHIDYLDNTSTKLFCTINSVDGSIHSYFSLSKEKNSVSFATYPSGMYFITITESDGNQWIQKIIKY